MKHLCYIFFSLTCLSFLCACSPEKESAPVILKKSTASIQDVGTVTLSESRFQHELISNGKVATKNIAETRFSSSADISKIYVHNGLRVKKGEPLAILDNYLLKQMHVQAKNALDRAQLDYQDVLIGQGYKINQIASVPPEIQQLARIKSGLNNAQVQWEIADHNLRNATLLSPINGVVANLTAKANTLSNPSAVFCNIIDQNSLEIVFNILESELSLIKVDDKIKVEPYALNSRSIAGRISEVNPWINEKGMIQVKGVVDGESGLLEGMNVRVHIFRALDHLWVVPKQAVVMRTGKQVVFTADKGKANWHCVKTGLENSTQYSITSETLKGGDLVIIEGNAGLSHGAPIKVTFQR